MKKTRDIDFVAFKIWVLVLAALSLALMFIEWISVWCIMIIVIEAKHLNEMPVYVWD